MDNGVITQKEALEIMRRKDVQGKPVPFDIEFRTFSRVTRTGGELKKYCKVKFLPGAAKKEEEEVTTIFNLFDPVKSAKDPNHYKNRTRNIELDNGDLKKVNIDFIISVNNQKVIY